MKSLIIICLSLLIYVPVLKAEDSICSQAASSKTDIENLRMKETDFTLERYERAMEYFESVIPKQIMKIQNNPNSNFSSTFWIGYRNHLKTLKGFTLMQAALLERSKGNEYNDGNAVKRFCEFLNEATFVD